MTHEGTIALAFACGSAVTFVAIFVLAAWPALRKSDPVGDGYRLALRHIDEDFVSAGADKTHVTLLRAISDRLQKDLLK